MYIKVNKILTTSFILYFGKVNTYIAKSINIAIVINIPMYSSTLKSTKK